MQKGIIESKDKGILFKGRLDFVLGQKEKEVLSILEIRVEELIRVRKEKKRRFRKKGKNVQKDKEVKKIATKVKEYLLDLQVVMLGIEIRGDSKKSVFIYSIAYLGLNLKVSSQKEVDSYIQVYIAVLTLRKLFILYNHQLKRKREVDLLVIKRGILED